MIKEWLIRTKNNHILGPVSKQKVKHLISNGSIKGDDEVCCGNGYWIYIREQNLIAKYIFGEDKQGFNPVQEVDPVLSINEPSAEDLAYPGEEVELNETDEDFDVDEFGNLMPSTDDLAYPDLDEEIIESQTDTTMIDVNFESLREKSEEEEEVEVDDTIDDTSSLEDDVTSDKKIPVKKKKVAAKKKPVKKGEASIPQKKAPKVTVRENSVKVKKSIISGNVLILIALFFLIVACVLFYYRKDIFNKAIVSKISLIDSAQAQEIVSKKKSGFHFLS